MEESEKLGVTYPALVDKLIAGCSKYQSVEELLRFFIQESLKQSMKQMIEESNSERSPVTYTEQTVQYLIGRIAQLRQMAGGTPTKGEAALEYLQIREVLKDKGVPLALIGL
jgi:hypothetical protein